ncbi:MAG: hypothetical protein JKX81_10615 [Arenicella sp.]|nr:hypothetical protein [Arenicella sp.]
MMIKLSNTLVYEWQAWDGFLISHLIADYCRMPASYFDQPADFDRFLTPNIKAVLLQVNLSEQGWYPQKRQQIIGYLKSRNILVLNAQIVDITKSALHLLLESVDLPHLGATQELSDDSQLFVKSNLNWGGEVEERLPKGLHAKFIGEQSRSITRFDEYYLTTKKSLRPDAWQDSTIVIEKYVTNDENSFYRVYALGESVVVVKAHSDHLIKKISGDRRDKNFLLSKEQLQTEQTLLPKGLQELLCAFTQRVPVDYFCLDIVHDNENFYVVDLNTTPYSGVQPQTSDASDFLCVGLKNYIAKQVFT